MLFPKKELDLSTPKVKCILILTTDSFFDGGKFLRKDNSFDESQIINSIESMIEDGADFIDIGAQSTKPGFTNSGNIYDPLGLGINIVVKDEEQFVDDDYTNTPWTSSDSYLSYDYLSIFDESEIFDSNELDQLTLYIIENSYDIDTEEIFYYSILYDETNYKEKSL